MDRWLDFEEGREELGGFRERWGLEGRNVVCFREVRVCKN